MKLNNCISLFLAVMLSGMTAKAESLTEGFYRVQNLGSGRYLYVRDCTGSVSTLGADLGAIELWSGVENTYSDPSSIMYLKSVSGGQWDILSQGTGVYQMSGYYLTIYQNASGCQLYNSGQYLYEIGESEIYAGMGILGASTPADQPGRSRYSVWPVHRVTNTGDDFFGIRPTLQQGNRYFTTFYADFAYTPLDNVTSYSVRQVDTEHAIAVIRPISGTVAKKQPVLVECTSASPSSNRLDLTTNAGSTASGNLLSGVFFACGRRSGINHPSTPAYVEFNSSTMRMLGLDTEGNLAFTDAPTNLETLTIRQNGKNVTLRCVPANQAYLTVAAGSPSTLRVMTESQYRHYIDSITPVITRDTVSGLIGSLTSGTLRALPYSTVLPIDTLTDFRLATIVRTVTTVGGSIVSTVSDTTYLGATEPNTYVTRDNIGTGFVCRGTYPLLLHTDASGRYEFTRPSTKRLKVTFPDLPVTVVTHDTAFSIAGTLTAGEMRPLPLTATLAIDSMVDFRIARIVRTSTRVGSLAPVIESDTLWLGARSAGDAVTRENPTFRLTPSALAVSLTADADGTYRFALTDTDAVTVTYPAPAVPVITSESSYHIVGTFTEGEYVSIPSKTYSLQLPLDSTVRFRFARIVRTTEKVGSRPAVVTFDTTLIGAATAQKAIDRSNALYSLGGEEYFSLTADVSGRYTFALMGETTLGVTFPAPYVTGETRDTLYYIQSGLASASLEPIPLHTASFRMAIDSEVRFRFARIIETRTIWEGLPAEFAYDTLWLGASMENEPLVRDLSAAGASSYPVQSSAFFFRLTADADGDYLLWLRSDSQLAVEFPALPVPVVASDTVWYCTAYSSFTANGWQPLPLSIDMALDSAVSFRFVRVVATTTTVGSRQPVLTRDTAYVGADTEDAFVTRDNAAAGYPLTGDRIMTLVADADGRYTLSLEPGPVLRISFPALPVPVVTSDTTHYLAVSFGEQFRLQPLPYTLLMERDTTVDVAVARVVESLTQIGSRRPVLSRDTTILGADIYGIELVRDSLDEASVVLNGDQFVSLTADVSGRYSFSFEGNVLLVAFPANPDALPSIFEDLNLTDSAIYDLLGRRYDCGFESLPAGFYIVGRRKVYKY